MTELPLDDARDRAVTLFDRYVRSEWDAVRADFDEEMQKLSAEKLAAGWSSIVDHVGAYDSAGAPTAYHRGGYTVVDVPLRFATGTLTGRVSYRGSGAIAGLFILDSDFAARN